MVKVKEGDTYYFKATVTRVNKFERSSSITFRLPAYEIPITINESTFEQALGVGSMVKDDARRP